MRCHLLRIALVLVFSGATSCGNVEAPTDVAGTYANATREIIYQVNVDSYVDEWIRSMGPSSPLKKPLDIDDVLRSIAKSIHLVLDKGKLRELKNVRRTGDCVTLYRRRAITLILNLGWDHIGFDYQYSIEFLLVKRTGLLVGDIRNLKVNVALDLDFATYEARLRRLHFVHAGSTQLKLKDHPMDWLYNFIIRTMTTVFKGVVVKSMESEAIKMVQRRIDELNNILGKSGGPRFKFVNTIPQHQEHPSIARK